MSETTNEKLLEARELSIIYKTDQETVYAVNGIGFDVARGETLGIVGETGAGKTTTALSILRLLPERIAQVTGGRVLFNGRDLLKLPEGEMRKIRGENISMIFQDPMTSLNPTLSVGFQIAEALAYHNDKNMSKEQIETRVDETLELVGIPRARKHEFPHQFSGGMKQRVVIAIALACEPELLIADEPTTALDVTIQAQVLHMMSGLRDRLGTAMILITHDLGIVAQICDKVAVMYAGEFVEYGSIFDLFSEGSHHPYTEGLFGSIPNLEVESDRLNPIDGLMPDPTNLPAGCKFSPRCPKCMERCKTQQPPQVQSGTHHIACHLFSERTVMGNA